MAVGKIFVGNSAASVEKSEKKARYNQVILLRSDNTMTKYPTSGTNPLYVTCDILPNSTVVASRIYSKINMIEYQPISITDAVINPATELGDAVTAAGVYTGVYAMDITYGAQTTTNIETKDIEDMNHELQWERT